jgi:hypothetical protein
VKQKRAHKERIARLHRTDDFLLFGAGFDDIGGIQSSHSMRTWDNAQGAVRFVTIIQMETESYHALQNFHWRLHVWNTVLGRPRTVASYINPLFDRDGKILMPRDKPVGLGRFIKKDGTHGQRLGSEHVLEQAQYFGRHWQHSNLWNLLHEIAVSGSSLHQA